MKQAQQGSLVRVNLVGALEDGTIFDSTLDLPDGCGDSCDTDSCDDDCFDEESGPVELKVGEGALFEAIEAAIVGMAPGEQRSVTIPAEEAFGPYDEEAVFTIERSSLPADITPEVGDHLTLYDEENEEDEGLEVTILEMTADMIKLDANHPLAGEDLQYTVELVEILD